MTYFGSFASNNTCEWIYFECIFKLLFRIAQNIKSYSNSHKSFSSRFLLVFFSASIQNGIKFFFHFSHAWNSRDLLLLSSAKPNTHTHSQEIFGSNLRLTLHSTKGNTQLPFFPCTRTVYATLKAIYVETCWGGFWSEKKISCSQLIYDDKVNLYGKDFNINRNWGRQRVGWKIF